MFLHIAFVVYVTKINILPYQLDPIICLYFFVTVSCNCILEFSWKALYGGSNVTRVSLHYFVFPKKDLLLLISVEIGHNKISDLIILELVFANEITLLGHL